MRHHIHTKGRSTEEAYTLHIDAKPVMHIPAHSAAGRAKSKIWAFVWDKLQFLGVSLVVFVFIYALVNWSALLVNFQYYWDSSRGVQSPLQNVAQDNVTGLDTIVTDFLGNSENLSGVPPLNIEVFPTDMRIVIPRINQNVPVVGVKNENLIARKWGELERDIQDALRSGVVHYPGTALPGENGNIVITGHSSYYAWDAGRFKDVFALLHDVQMGDKIIVYFNQKKFVYEVFDIKKVSPKDVDVLAPSEKEQLTLITCTPIGTNLRRLIVTARLVEK